MFLIIQRAVAGLEIEKRWPDGVLWSPCWDSHWWQLVWKYYMTVGSHPLSVFKLNLASAGVFAKRRLLLGSNMVKRPSPSLKICKRSKSFCHIRWKPKWMAKKWRLSIDAAQHKIFLEKSPVGKSAPELAWLHILKPGVPPFLKSVF